MFEDMNYAELEEWRDELLLENVGVSYDDPNFEENRKWIEAISREMEYRESEAAKRIKKTVWAVNILVLAAIIFLSGCTTAIRGTGQMISGIGQGTGTIITGVGDYLQEEMEGK